MAVQNVHRFSSLITDNSPEAVMKARKDIAANIINTKGADTGWKGIDLFLLRACSMFSERCKLTQAALDETHIICNALGNYNSEENANDVANGMVNLFLASKVYNILNMDMCFEVRAYGDDSKVILNDRNAPNNQEFSCEISVTSQQAVALRCLAGDVSFYDMGDKNMHATLSNINECFNPGALNDAQQELAKRLLSLSGNETKAFTDAWIYSLNTFEQAKSQISNIISKYNLDLGHESTLNSDFFYEIYSTPEQGRFNRAQMGDVVKVVLTGLDHMTRIVAMNKITTEVRTRKAKIVEEIDRNKTEESLFVKRQAETLRFMINSLVHELRASAMEEPHNDLQGFESVETDINFLPRSFQKQLRHCINSCDDCKTIDHLEKTAQLVSHLMTNAPGRLIRSLDKELVKNRAAQAELQQKLNKASDAIDGYEEQLIENTYSRNEQLLQIEMAASEITAAEGNIPKYQGLSEEAKKSIDGQNQAQQALLEAYGKLESEVARLTEGLNGFLAAEKVVGTDWLDSFADITTQMTRFCDEANRVKDDIDSQQPKAFASAENYKDKVKFQMQFSEPEIKAYSTLIAKRNVLRSCEQAFLHAFEDRYGLKWHDSLLSYPFFVFQEEEDYARREFGDNLLAIDSLDVKGIQRVLPDLVRARNKKIKEENRLLADKKMKLKPTNAQAELAWLQETGLTRYVDLNREVISASREMAQNIAQKKALIKQILLSALSLKKDLEDISLTNRQFNQLISSLQQKAKNVLDENPRMPMDEDKLKQLQNALQASEAEASRGGAKDEIESRLNTLITEVFTKFVSGYSYLRDANSIKDIKYVFDKEDDAPVDGNSLVIDLTEADKEKINWLSDYISDEFIKTVKKHFKRNEGYLDKLRAQYNSWDNKLNELKTQYSSYLKELDASKSFYDTSLKENRAKQEENQRQQNEVISEIKRLEVELTFYQKQAELCAQNIKTQQAIIQSATKSIDSLDKKRVRINAKQSEARALVERLKTSQDALKTEMGRKLTEKEKLDKWNISGNVNDSIHKITEQISKHKEVRQRLNDTQIFLNDVEANLNGGILGRWVSEGNIGGDRDKYSGTFLGTSIPYNASGEDLAKLWSNHSYWLGNSNAKVRLAVDKQTSAGSGVLSNATSMDGTRRIIDEVQNEVFQRLFKPEDNDSQLLSDVRTSVESFCRENGKEFNYISLQEYTAAKFNALKSTEQQLRQVSNALRANLQKDIDRLKQDIYKSQMVLGVYLSSVISDRRVVHLLKQRQGVNYSAIFAESAGRLQFNARDSLDTSREALDSAVGKYASARNQKSSVSMFRMFSEGASDTDMSLVTPISEYVLYLLNIKSFEASLEMASGKLNQIQRKFVPPSLNLLLRFGLPGTLKGMDFLFGVTDVAGGERMPGQTNEMDDDYQRFVEERQKWVTGNSAFQNDVSGICTKAQLKLVKS